MSVKDVLPELFCLVGREGVYRVSASHTDELEGDGLVAVERRRYRDGGMVWVEDIDVPIDNLLDNERPDSWRHVPPGPSTFVNVYEVTRHYGGREEGGWWYNVGVPLASIPLLPGQDLDEIVSNVTNAYADQEHGSIYSMRGGVHIQVVLEDHFAAAWPRERPHYE